MDLRNVHTFDVTAIHGFVEILQDYSTRNIMVCLVKLKDSTKELFWRSGAMDILGIDRVFSKTSDAVSFIEGNLKEYSSYNF